MQTLVIPFIVLSILNISIGYKILRSSQSNIAKSRRYSSNTTSLPVEFISLHSSISNRGPRTSISLSDMKKHQLKSNKESHTLFIIASIFLLLNFPITFNKCYNFFTDKNAETQLDLSNIEYASSSQLMDQNHIFVKIKDKNMTVVLDATKELKNIHRKEIRSKLSSYIYYINFSINFFLYTCNLKKFKENFIKLFKK